MPKKLLKTQLMEQFEFSLFSEKSTALVPKKSSKKQKTKCNFL